MDGGGWAWGWAGVLRRLGRLVPLRRLISFGLAIDLGGGGLLVASAAAVASVALSSWNREMKTVRPVLTQAAREVSGPGGRSSPLSLPSALASGLLIDGRYSYR